MIDISYYRKIQNAYGAKSLRDAKTQQVKMDLNKDFDKPLDCFTVLVDGIEKDLTIIETTNLDEKKIKARPNTTFNSGQIVEWMDWYWIITKVNRRNDIITNGKMKECNYLLKWQNESGVIKERWCVTQNAVQYNNGESGNSTITLGSDQLMILIPYDKDTIKLRRGKRFFISNDLEEPIVYELTRPDSTTYVKDGHGYLCIMVTEDQTNSENDRKDLMLCDYVDIPTKPDNPNQSTILSQISCTSPTIKVGAPYRTFKCSIMDVDGNTLDDIGVWTINCNFADKLIPNITGNQIKIKISDEYQELIGQEFELIFNNSTGTDSTKIVISIEENI